MIAKPLSALALAAAVALPAMAGAQAGPPAAGQPHAQGRDGAMREAMMRQHEARRLQALHDVLGIRPDQDSAFQAFAAAMRPQAPPEGWDHGDKDHGPGQMAGLTTPQRLDRMAQMMEAREARRRTEFQRVSGAVKTLYAALTPEQRRAFDALPALLGPGFGLGGHMGHDGHMMAGGMGRHDGGRPMGPPPSSPGA